MVFVTLKLVLKFPNIFVMSFDSKGMYMVLVTFEEYMGPCISMEGVAYRHVLHRNVAMPKSSCLQAFPMYWLLPNFKRLDFYEFFITGFDQNSLNILFLCRDSLSIC